METERLLRALKEQLRQQGVSYRDVASALELSESSVKRLFTNHSFTLPRLEKICELAGTNLATLVQIADSAEEKIHQLTLAQEQEFVQDVKLLLVGVCIINHCSFAEILEKYRIEELELIQLFARLDRMGLIDYLPGNRYRLKISRHFQWQRNGPVQRFLVETVLNEHLAKGFKRNKNLHYVWGMLSQESATEFTTRVERLIEEYLLIAEKDAKRPMQEKLTSSLLVLFSEDWEPEVFVKQWRKA